MLSKKRYMLGKKGLSEKRTKWKENDLGKRQTTEAKWKPNGCRVNAERRRNGNRVSAE